MIGLDDVARLLNPAFAHAARWQFIDTVKVAPALRAADVPYYVMVKIDEPVDYKIARIAEISTQLPLCRVQYLYSAGLLFGYLLEVPNFVVTVRPNMVTIVRPTATQEHKFTDSQMVLQNSHLSVFHSGDGASLVTFTERFANLNPDILKGSNG